MLPASRAASIAAAAAALLFAVHAVHVESVTNTVGRAELLSAVAFFASLLCYQRLLRSTAAGGRLRRCGWRCAGGTVCLAGAGMLCKEVSITALLVCAAPTGWRRCAAWLAPGALAQLRRGSHSGRRRSGAAAAAAATQRLAVANLQRGGQLGRSARRRGARPLLLVPH